MTLFNIKLQFYLCCSERIILNLHGRFNDKKTIDKYMQFRNEFQAILYSNILYIIYANNKTRQIKHIASVISF